MAGVNEAIEELREAWRAECLRTTTIGVGDIEQIECDGTMRDGVSHDRVKSPGESGQPIRLKDTNPRRQRGVLVVLSFERTQDEQGDTNEMIEHVLTIALILRVPYSLKLEDVFGLGQC